MVPVFFFSYLAYIFTESACTINHYLDFLVFSVNVLLIKMLISLSVSTTECPYVLKVHNVHNVQSLESCNNADENDDDDDELGIYSLYSLATNVKAIKSHQVHRGT